MRRLQHHANPRLDSVQRKVLVVPTTDADRAALGLVEAADQIDERGLSAARGANQGNGFAPLDLQAKAGEHRVVGLVPEIHLVEHDVAADGARVHCARLVHHVWHRVDQGKDTLSGGDGMLHLGVHSRHLLDRPEHERNIGNKGPDAADGHSPHLCLQPAVPDDAGHGYRADQLHHGKEQGGKPGRPVRGAVHVLGEFAELAQVLLFSA